MGIIEKQATQNMILSYLGAGLGFLTVIWLPYLLSTDENGLIRIFVSTTALLAQFGNLGFTSVTIRFFPYFRNKEKGHHGFLFYALKVSSIGFLLCFVTFLILKEDIIQSNLEKSKLFVDYLFYLMPLTFFVLFFNIFDTYLRATYSSVIGSFTKDILQRVMILVLLATYCFKIIDFSTFIFFYITATCLPTLVLMFYIVKQEEWHIKPVRGFLSRELRTEMIKLGFYSILSGGGGAIILNIDAIMVNQALGLKQTGIYGIAFFFGSMILIPARSLYRISSSIVAEAFKKNNLKEIHSLYKKSCNSQLAIGALLFIGICANIDNIMKLLPEDYASGRNVILVLSAGYLVEMATGINQVIIVNSKLYKYDAYIVFLVVGITIIANYILIPIYGIVGSAIATA
ncbi:MAG: oligosaccharide flippase family protein, partial [Bacteroidetes bacterium]|nr:oligosaccharide flippase family protein [Bacteroidota bacterium]